MPATMTPLLRSLLSETRLGELIVEGADDPIAEARAYVEQLRFKAYLRHQEGESLINDAVRIRSNADSIAAALAAPLPPLAEVTGWSQRTPREQFKPRKPRAAMPLDAPPPDGSAPRPLTDADARRLCAALAPLQALDADARSVGCAPATPSGTRDPDASRAQQVDSRAIERARPAWRRLVLVPLDPRATLLEVAAVAHAHMSATELAAHVATRAHRSLDAEEALAVARAEAAAAESAHTLAAQRYEMLAAGGRRLAPTTLAALRERTTAAGRRDAAAARERAADGALTARGARLLREALTAWDATETEE